MAKDKTETTEVVGETAGKEATVPAAPEAAAPMKRFRVYCQDCIMPDDIVEAGDVQAARKVYLDKFGIQVPGGNLTIDEAAPDERSRFVAG